MSSTTLTIDQLRLSPFNVRTNAEDASDTTALEASIFTEGVLQSLSVHPLDGEPGLYGVFAGGRRYRSVRNLVDRGELPCDFALPVFVDEAPAAELVARSLAENLLRRDLRLYETYAAIAREHALGHTPEQIAARHGQAIAWVRRGIRVGNLAPPIFAALEAERISTDQAKAFAATADHELQLAAFTTLMAGPEHNRTAAAIRAWLGVDDREAGKLLRFVGEDAYFAAGGAFERDLFADGADDSGRVTDDKLLRGLADEKVAALREDVRARAGRPDLRFVPQPPQAAHGTPDYILLIHPAPALSFEQQQRLDELRIAPDADPAQIAAIEAAAGQVLPDGDVVAHIAIDADGEPDVTFWWASRAAQGGPKPARPAPARAGDRLRPGAAIGQQYDGSRQQADAAIKEEAGLTREGTDTMRSIRRSILRAALIQDAIEGRTLGRDYLVWAQLRMLLSTAGKYDHAEGQAEVGMRGLHSADADAEPARAQIAATEAGRAWARAVRAIQGESFLTEPDLRAALLDFRNAPQAKRDLAAAIVAGIALERSLDAAGYAVPVHDELAVLGRVALPQGIRHWWQPSEAFLKLLPRDEQLAIAEPFVENAVFATWRTLKVDELRQHVLRVVTGKAPSLRKRLAIAAAQWVHPLLAFRRDGGAPPGPGNDDQIDLEDAIREAAE